MNARILAICLISLLGFNSVRAQLYNTTFGITPKTEHIHVASEADAQAWHFHFRDTADFVRHVQQPPFILLTSGATDVAYYALFRKQPDVLIFAYSYRNEEKRNGSFDISGKDGSQSMIVGKSPLSIVDFLDTYVVQSGTLSGGASYQRYQIRQLLGYATRIKPSYSGPLTVSFQLWTEGQDKVRSQGTATVDWTKP